MHGPLPSSHESLQAHGIEVIGHPVDFLSARVILIKRGVNKALQEKRLQGSLTDLYAEYPYL